MTAKRWQQIDKVLQTAIERPENHRALLLHEACAGDEACELIRWMRAEADPAFGQTGVIGLGILFRLTRWRPASKLT